MYKLYLLGALALSNVEAYVSIPYTFGPPAAATGLPSSFFQYTYAVTADCFSAGTATMLGLNNMYHEYFQFTMSKGTVAFAAFTYTTIPAATIGTAATYAYKGCYHAHLYNWMAQPQIGSLTSVAGLGNSGASYGYQMTGTAVTACTMTTVTTTSIYKTNVFYGGQWQSISSILNGADLVSLAAQIASAAAQTTIIAYLNNYVQPTGNNYLYTPIVTVQAWVKGGGTITITIAGILGVDLKSASTTYWDFMQTNIFTGQTQFGRGGGATSPCGWWVVYANEAPAGQQQGSGTGGTAVSPFNIQPDASDLLVNMWTDNALTNTLCAFVMASLAAILY